MTPDQYEKMIAVPRNNFTREFPEKVELPEIELKDNLFLLARIAALLINIINFPLNIVPNQNVIVWSLNTISCILCVMSLLYEKMIAINYPALLMILIKMQV